MSGRVIQGFFVNGRGRPLPATVQRAQPVGAVSARPMPGPPPPAFAGRALTAQAKPAPGRPPLVHQTAQVAQPFGGADSFEIDPAQVGLARGGGRPLPQAVLAKMEAAFSAEFSAVRVHEGPQAPRIGAIAFTMGDDLYFAPGRFQPESVQGQQLIGHELAHVIQQRQGRVRAPGSGVVVVQDRALEAEADRLGMRAAMQGGTEHRMPAGRSGFQEISGPGRVGALIQRQISVGGKPYSSREAYRELNRRGLTSYQRDDEVRAGLKYISRNLAVDFARWGDVFWSALRYAAEAPVRRPRARPARRSILDATEFAGAESLALQILKAFPPRDYFYIGLGRSPTPVIAYLFRLNREAELLGNLAQLVVNLPLSGFRPKLQSAWTNPHKLEAPLSREQSKELARHFDRLLPTPQALGARNVLVIDYTQTARSLIASSEHIQAHLHARSSVFGRTPKVLSLALCVEEYVQTVRATGLANIMVIPGSLTEPTSLAFKIGGGDYYDKYAEFGGFYITKGERTESIAAPNPEFADLEHDMYVRSKGYEPL